jgi:excisionase family DNA binding protein
MIKMGIDADRLYSVAEVAKILNVARSTMERYIRQSRIEYINLGSGRQYTAVRILGSTLIDFLEKSIVTVERKPLYETEARENSIFRGMPGRC